MRWVLGCAVVALAILAFPRDRSTRGREAPGREGAPAPPSIEPAKPAPETEPPALTEPTAEEPVYRMSGWVMANAPLVGARVRVFGTSGRPPDDAPLLAETLTVEEGRYELVLPRGGPMLALFEGGNRRPQLREFTTTPMEPEAELLLALPRGRAITVTVVGDGDAPVAGAVVRVPADIRKHGKLHYRTGADGRVSLVLPPKVKVDVRADGYAPVILGPPWSRRVVLERGIRLQGTVVDSAGRPLPRAGLANDLGTNFTRADAHGRFAWQHLPSATKRITARANGYLPREVELASASTPFVVTLLRAGHIRGSVVRADGSPVHSAEVTGASFSAKTWTNLRGHFDLVHLPLGDLEIVVREPSLDRSFFSLRAPRATGRVRVRLTEGELLGGVRIVVRPPEASFLRIDAADVGVKEVETSVECFDRSRDRLTSEILLLVAAPAGSRVRVSAGNNAAIAVSAATVEDAKAAVLTVR